MILKAKVLLEKKKLRYVFPVTKKTYSNNNPIWIKKNWKISSKKGDSQKFFDAGQFYWGKSINWEKKKRIFSKNSGVLYFKNTKLIDVNFDNDWKKLKLIYKNKNL